MTVKVEEGQTIFDFALYYYGCFEGFELIMEDNDLSLDADIIPGQNLFIRDVCPVLNDTNQLMAAQFQSNNIVFNSGFQFDLIPNGYVQDGYVQPGYVS